MLETIMTPEDTFYYSKLASLGIEEWLPIPGYEGSYEASNLGRIRSLERVVNTSRQGVPVKKPVQGRMISQCNSGSSGGKYLGFKLNLEGKQVSVSTHVAVMLSFAGPRPEGEHICHRNGNGKDNRLFNLRYDTPENNYDDRRKHGTDISGEKNPSSKLTTENVLAIKRLLEEKVPGKQIAKLFDVTDVLISQIKLGKAWKHIQI